MTHFYIGEKIKETCWWTKRFWGSLYASKPICEKAKQKQVLFLKLGKYGNLENVELVVFGTWSISENMDNFSRCPRKNRYGVFLDTSKIWGKHHRSKILKWNMLEQDYEMQAIWLVLWAWHPCSNINELGKACSREMETCSFIFMTSDTLNMYIIYIYT